MAFCFLDTSALVKHYIDEPGSRWLRDQITSDSSLRICLSRMTIVELFSAIGRRERAEEISSSHADGVLTLFLHDAIEKWRIVELHPEIAMQAAELSRKHSLRAYDAVQLASAVALHSRLLPEPLTFISSDHELNAAAESEGFTVENPNEKN